ncbi:medium-chain acyl-CoA ligase ACSF2, mitochondrial, partial [Trichonephila inaurata madagascariensis]
MRFLRVQKTLTDLLRLHNVHVRCASGVQQKLSYVFKGGDILLTDLRVGDLIDRSADKCGDDVAFISMHQDISKTFSEMRREVERLASGFISIGLRKGDKIAIFSPNCYEWPLTQYAAAKAGLILVNINPALQKMEVEYCLKKVKCKAVVTWDVFKTQDYYKIMCDLIPELPKSKPGHIRNSNLPNLESVIMISDNKMDGTFDFKDVLDSGNKESDKLLSEIEKSIQFDDPVNIQYTSGTTGTPKGATLNHHSLVNNCLIGASRLRFHLS